MSMTVEISNPRNLSKVRSLLGAKTDSEAIDLALERVINYAEPSVETPTKNRNHDLPDEYWEELFSEPQIPSSVIDRILREEREDRF